MGIWIERRTCALWFTTIIIENIILASVLAVCIFSFEYLLFVPLLSFSLRLSLSSSASLFFSLSFRLHSSFFIIFLILRQPLLFPVALSITYPTFIPSSRVVESVFLTLRTTNFIFLSKHHCIGIAWTLTLAQILLSIMIHREQITVDSTT